MTVDACAVCCGPCDDVRHTNMLLADWLGTTPDVVATMTPAARSELVERFDEHMHEIDREVRQQIAAKEGTN